ncbi:Evolutionarily conserved signaling intermediate in Toll pathway, mitochondrial [Habropoda laboriosa]|uniref:Evolutionarily conserved signaling intermediate in Toll pathway, mitochondrial n=2 Tax=Habropoda laboriosa TaxID=597456 RepID=A0A0L7QUB0_9HYME|nr:Evolutionarily conserved signaling intermediate in Toll pathway, mitochondrial [Habropoda laboriosa]
MIVNSFHSNHQVLYNKKKVESSLIPSRFNVDRKEKETFLDIIHKYTKEDTARIGQLKFIMVALKFMDEFGVNKDIQTYKAIFNIFPKGIYVPENKYQNALYHYPHHQDTAMAILRKMEDNFVIPDYEMYHIVLNTFGGKSLVAKKVYSLLYWFPKFANLNPWPVPKPTPTDPKDLAYLALEKISSIDCQTNITVYRTNNVPDAIDDTWIVSSMSQSQQELLAVQPTDKSLYVEGPISVWVDQYYIDYFVLKGDPIKRKIIYGEYDDVSNLKIPFWEKHNFKIPVTIHEQEDGVYYAICATGTSSKDSLLSWIRCLQKTNPILKDVPITFKMRSFTVKSSHIDEGERVSNVKQII